MDRYHPWVPELVAGKLIWMSRVLISINTIKEIKMGIMICGFCGRTCNSASGRGVHERFCSQNPNRKDRKSRVAWNKGLTGDLRCSRSHMLGKPHTSETKERLSKVAKNRGFGGYRANAGRSQKYKVLDSYGKEVTLQSSYELRCSVILNELNISWIRPKALKYDGRNYFADFYLPDYDIWLDPKNAYKAKQDEEKIRKVIEQNGIKLIVLLDDQLTKDSILRQLGSGAIA